MSDEFDSAFLIRARECRDLSQIFAEAPPEQSWGARSLAFLLQCRAESYEKTNKK